jgi:hypothetical protein
MPRAVTHFPNLSTTRTLSDDSKERHVVKESAFAPQDLLPDNRLHLTERSAVMCVRIGAGTTRRRI